MSRSQQKLFAVLLTLTVAVALPAKGQPRVSAQNCLSHTTDVPSELDGRIAACLLVIGDTMASADVRAEAYLRRALAYAQKAEAFGDNNDVDRAIADLDEGMRLDPNNPSAQYYALQMRAGLQYHKGNYDYAIADYTSLLKLDSNAAAIFDYRGIVFAARGDHARAISDFTEAIRRQPQMPLFYSQRASAYLRSGRPVEASQDIDRAIALDPDQAGLYAVRVLINRVTGNTDQVVADLRKALSLEPSNPDIEKELQQAETEQAARVAAAPAAAPPPEAPAPAAKAPAANDDGAARRDYEFAAQVGNAEAWQAFLKQYQTGFYADLARAQLAKLGSPPATPDRAQAERERALAKEQAEKERLAKEQAEKDRLAKEQAEKDRLAKEQAEKERLAKEQAEKDRLAKEQAEKERLAKEQAEKDRLAKEQAEKERLAKEQAEKERLAKEQAEKERLAKEQAEKERFAKEQAEKDRLAKEQAEKERLAKEQAEKERLAKEQAEKDRLAKEQAEKERLAKEQAEKDRLAKEQAEKDRLAEAAAAKLKTAELTPPAANPAAASAALTGAALVAEIKKELSRVGCYAGPIDDKWTTSQTGAAVKRFIKTAGIGTSSDEPTMEFLDTLRGRTDRVCPLQCGVREVESGGQCVAKTCNSGFDLDEDGDCIRQKVHRREVERGERREVERPRGGRRFAEEGRRNAENDTINAMPCRGRGGMNRNKHRLGGGGCGY